MKEKKVNMPTLAKTKWGFYQYKPLPSVQELSEFYEKKYYQEGHGNYSFEYTDEEIEYFRLKATLIYRKLMQLSDDQSKKTLLDIGCGEGWVLDTFEPHCESILGLDYSDFAIKKYHPHLLKNFRKGDVHHQLQEMIENGVVFDFVVMTNVIEHVVDPVFLLKAIKKILGKEGTLVVVAPNDFSPLHMHLLEKGVIKNEFWVSYPEHLSYFNKESMCGLLDDLDYHLHTVVADNPIDLNLLNDNSNYILDKTKGKATHFYRVKVDNFLARLDVDQLLKYYEVLGGMGVGRDLAYYCTIKK